MSMILNDVTKEIKEIKRMLKKVDDFLRKAPKGALNYKKVKGKIYYYQQIFDGKLIQKYIRRKNEPIAKALAQKSYYQKVKQVLQVQLDQLTNLENCYEPEQLDKIYDELSDIRKDLVVPLRLSVAEKIRRWNEEIYEENSSHPENKIFETEQGEFVRSKSEVIIANLLYHNRNDILYKYERPITLIKDRKEIIVYPDFTILNKKTGRIVYLEHIGMLDAAYYANDFVWKVNTYVENNLIPGRNVIFTYESSKYPLDMRVLNKMLREAILQE